jgi:hypothetical protein
MNIKAIFLGFLTGPFLALMAGNINSYLGITIISKLFFTLATEEKWLSGYFLVSHFLINAGFALLGGYIAGRIAKQNEYLHAGVVSILGVLANIGILTLTLQYFNFPITEMIITIIKLLFTTMPYAMVGAHLSRIKNLKETTKS